eukprot:6002590-Prymnesium_polylepis.1
MLIYLTTLTWTYEPELLAAEIRQAQRQGLHLQPCNEFPSVVETGNERYALEFKQVMDATPADLKRWLTNIYSQIAIALKGGEQRGPGLAILAGRLAQRVSRTAYVPDWLAKSEGETRQRPRRLPTSKNVTFVKKNSNFSARQQLVGRFNMQRSCCWSHSARRRRGGRGFLNSCSEKN